MRDSNLRQVARVARSRQVARHRGCGASTERLSDSARRWSASGELPVEYAMLGPKTEGGRYERRIGDPLLRIERDQELVAHAASREDDVVGGLKQPCDLLRSGAAQVELSRMTSDSRVL